MNQVVIDKDIEIPKSGTRGALKKILLSLEIGDSFLWSDRSNVSTFAKIHGVKITTRKEGDKFRIWRVE